MDRCQVCFSLLRSQSIYITLLLQAYLGTYKIRVHLLQPELPYVNSPLCSMRYGNAVLPAGVAPLSAVENGRSLAG